MWSRAVRCVVMLALVLLTAPLAVQAQPATKVYRIGIVRPSTASATASSNEAFTQRLRELGYTEGQNLVIEARFAQSQAERIPALVTELIQDPGRLSRGRLHHSHSRRQTGDEHHPDRHD